MLSQFFIAILNVTYLKIFFATKDELVNKSDFLGMFNLGFLCAVLIFINYKFLYEPILKRKDDN